ncbi:MAG: hypothetical protein HY769_02695 [Candidatus Stahlbacteria bacterium]|nr:hypothetical protein [Candidatus Stahlbacteria bacterium]
MFLFYITLSIYWSDWTNYGIEELLMRAGTGKNAYPTIFVGTKPIERKELQRFLDGSIKTSTNVVDSSGIWIKDRLSLALQDFESLELESGVLQDSFTQYYALLGKGVKSNFLTIFLDVAAKLGDSCGYPAKRWKGVIAADYLKGYVKGSMFNFTLSIGREPIKWGPSPRNTFVLCGDLPAFDLIRASYKTNKLKTTFFATLLNPIGEINRYFTGHRIEYNFRHKLYLGFSEVALFGGEGRAPDLYYFNPLFIYYPHQWSCKSSTNILWGLDFNLFLNGFGVYGELMIDDFPYIQSSWGEHPKIGVNMGIRGTISKNYWLIEYTTATRWTYGQVIPWQRYTYFGYPIGNPIGPDFDELFIGWVHHLNRNVDLLLETKFLRKGEGFLDEKYPSSTERFPTEYWLTGEIRKAGDFEVGIKWYKSRFVLTFKTGCIISEEKAIPKVSCFISNWK